MMQVRQLKNKEGWVYLLHAVGTERYKVGRSKEPIERQKQLVKQSPYPLKMLDSFFTIKGVKPRLFSGRGCKPLL